MALRKGLFLFAVLFLALGGIDPLTAAAPKANFTFTPAAPVAGQAVTFTDTSTGSPSAWSWNFGDGGTSSAPNPCHAYATAGRFTVVLRVSNASGSSKVSRTLVVSAAPPVAGFSFSPSVPSAGQAVSFTDTSSGSPKSWSWTFGDGGTSSLQNPNHAYSAGGAFTVTLTVRNAGGIATVSHAVTVSQAGSTSFDGNIMLGSPTATSIKASVFSPDQSGTIYLSYGTSSSTGTNSNQTAQAVLEAATPLVLRLDRLSPDTQYYYRLHFQASGETGFAQSSEYTFHTARPPGSGSTFTFTIQADSHLDQNSILDVYRRTLANVLADAPDFHLDLGDTFMCEKHSAPLTSTVQMAPDQATVDARYVYERGNFGLVAHSVPLFLVNGNHEGELGWLADGTADNIAVWATRARQQFFLNPLPDGVFYDSDSVQEPFVDLRTSWYAWHWGNALFVVLDPFWFTKTKSGTDGWVYTLGKHQYEWLQQTLSLSPATFKFVFIHNLVGGLDGQMRGGVEAAPYFEWGGRNSDGTNGFSQKRPGWGTPIHQLLVQNGVTAVFHGHDHLYARQELDGIVYQAVPQPSARNYSNGPTLASQYHYESGTILSSSGHLRVTVSPEGVTVQYVRAWLPGQETTQRKNGQVDDSWTVVTNGGSRAR